MGYHRAGRRLLLLGAAQALRESTPLHLERKESLALLAYLTVNKGSHLRERIGAFLWPDSGALDSELPQSDRIRGGRSAKTSPGRRPIMKFSEPGWYLDNSGKR